MTDDGARYAALRARVEAPVAGAIERLLREASDFDVNRINPIAFARTEGLDETACISAFLHATQAGLVDLAWNVVCDGCGGILHSADSLRAVREDRYRCALCAADCQPVLDEAVEVTFTVSPGIRAIAAHEPDRLPLWDFVRQIYWSSGSDLPADLRSVVRGIALDAVELMPRQTAVIDLDLREGVVVVFDPVTHSSIQLHVAGALTEEVEELALSIGGGESSAPLELAPGPLQLTLDNRTDARVLPIVWQAGEALRQLVSRRVPALSARRLLSHQTFRDLYRTGVLNPGQRFRIASLTFLFTDLKGSTALYRRVGDLAAFDLIREHFEALTAIIAAHSGAMVKTIGDAVMATFPSPGDGMGAALRMRGAMNELNARHGGSDALLKIGLHAGPCLAVMLNERQDYFGHTVNVAARVQGLAYADRIVVTEAVLADDHARSLIENQGLKTTHSRRILRGLEEETSVYEIA